MERNKFLVKLKKLINKLENNSISYEIPYCPQDQLNFEYITIVVPDTTSTSDITSLFDTFVKVTDNKTNCIVVADDLTWFFVRANITDLKRYLNYYSWGVTPYIMQAIFNGIGLSYKPSGLWFKHNDNEVLITQDIKAIFDLLGIDFKSLYGINIPTTNVVFKTVLNSPFINSIFFELNKMEKYDPLYNFNSRLYYDFFKKTVDLDVPFNIQEWTIESTIDFLDSQFPNLLLMQRIYKKDIMTNKTIKEIKNVSWLDKMKNKMDVIQEHVKKNKVKMSVKKVTKENLEEFAKKIKYDGDNIILPD